jgi:hypothetical protein
MKHICIGLLVLAGLTACGGGGGAGNSGAGTALPPVPGSFGGSAASTTTGSFTASGTISAIAPNVIALQTGYPHGLIDVYTTSSTQISGKLTVSENVKIIGAGSWTTKVTATSIAPISGTTGATSLPAATPTPIATATPPGAPVTVPTGVVTTSGIVNSVSATMMSLNQGYPHGNIDIAIKSATMQIGQGGAGKYALVTGTGTVSSSMTATVISYYSAAPASVSVAGTVKAATSYGFTLATSTDGALPVVLTPATIIAGSPLTVGATVNVTGTGWASEEVSALTVVSGSPTGSQPSTTPTPGPIAQTHVLSGDYLAGYYGTTSVPYSIAARYLTWAQTSGADSSAIRAAGIKTMLYTNPNRTQSNDPMYTSDNTTFAHTCAGSKITVPYGNGITQYIMDPGSTDLGNLYTKTIENLAAGTTFDAVFEDNLGPLELTGVSTMPCNYSDSTWLAEEAHLASYSPYPVIINSLSPLNGHNPSPTIPMATAPNTLGAVYEGCYSDNNSAEYTNWLWQTVENTELQVTAENAMFLCMLRNTNAASANTQARLYALASFLLTYNPASSVLWEEFSTPSGLHVMPEEGLVVKNPVGSTPSSIAGLLTNTGAYGRQYQDCYLNGNFVGPCAIAVNPTASNVLFPYPQYTHTLTISGSGVLDGGAISTSGAAPATYLAPENAVIAFP